MSPYEFFLSFEWLRGLLVAQVVRAALNAASRAPPRSWFALEQDAASPAAMEAGVRASSAFVVVLTDGYFTHNVRHEVACAVAAGKRVVVLHDVDCGRGVEALLDQAAALADPAVIAGKGLRHLDAAGATAFKARALAGSVIPFYRDARLVTEVAPALAAALAAGVAAPPPPALQKPFKVRGLRPALGDCDALFVAAGDAVLQALYLAEAAKGACGARPLVAEALLTGGGAVGAEALSGAADLFVGDSGGSSVGGSSGSGGEAIVSASLPWQCAVCEGQNSGGELCELCEQPRAVISELHEHFLVRVVAKDAYPGNRACCDSCGASDIDPDYHCAECEFDLCEDCIAGVVTVEKAVARAGAVVLVLSRDAWGDATFVGAARAALGTKKKLTLVRRTRTLAARPPLARSWRPRPQS